MPTLRTKRCSKCKREKKAKFFYKSERATSGLQSWCISCHRKKPRKREVVSFECERCHQMCKRVAKPVYKEVERRKVCCRCLRLERLARNGGHPGNYKGTQYFPGNTIASWKQSALRRGHKWELTNTDLDVLYEKQKGICALSGIPMIWAGPRPYRPSIDRKDSVLGYTSENVQFVCTIVNIMKNKIDEPEFFRLCALITDYRG